MENSCPEERGIENKWKTKREKAYSPPTGKVPRDNFPS